MATEGDMQAAVAEALGTSVVASSPLHGGMVGRVQKLELADGRTVVAKTSEGSDLRVEALMLRTLEEKSPLPVPSVQHESEELLVLSFLPGETGVGGEEAQEHLAELLAATHEVRGGAFGFERDTLLGPLRMPNEWHSDGVAFFRDQRLLWALGHADASGSLPRAEATRVERTAERLPDLLSQHEPVPVLLHGDLWSGNVLTEGERVTGVLDPAVHYGDAETELAFVDLFGGVEDVFWDRYRELRDLPEAFFGWRRWLWQLVPLLVHVALFGEGYVPALARRLERVEHRP